VGQGRTATNVETLGGKPCVRGARLSVELLLGLAASGATHADILARYPQLTAEGLVRGIPLRRTADQQRTQLGSSGLGMNPLEFALLADENVAPEVVVAMRERHLDVVTAGELGLSGAPDSALLARAAAQSRVSAPPEVPDRGRHRDLGRGLDHRLAGRGYARVRRGAFAAKIRDPRHRATPGCGAQVVHLLCMLGRGMAGSGVSRCPEAEREGPEKPTRTGPGPPSSRLRSQ